MCGSRVYAFGLPEIILGFGNFRGGGACHEAKKSVGDRRRPGSIIVKGQFRTDGILPANAANSDCSRD
jgi:hypothetical protein